MYVDNETSLGNASCIELGRLGNGLFEKDIISTFCLFC